MGDILAYAFAIFLISIPIIALFLGPIMNLLDRLRGNKRQLEEIKPPATFKIKRLTFYYRLNIILASTFSVYLVLFYLQGKYQLFLRLFLLILAFSLFRTLTLMNEPKDVVLSEEGLAFNKVFSKKINWEEVEKIDFTIPSRYWSNQTIEVSLKDSKQKLRFYPYNYNDHKIFRRLFEQLSVAKGVTVRVEDRGI